MPDPILHAVNKVTATNEAGIYIVNVDLTDMDGATSNEDYCSRPDDPYGLNPTIRQWLADHEGQYTVEPYVPPADPGPRPYQIAKTTPWLRMTADEAAIMDAVMSETDARTKQIYMAATYLSSGDELWTTLWQLVADNIGESRAAVILAPET
jgi:hypothetical protein